MADSSPTDSVGSNSSWSVARGREADLPRVALLSIMLLLRVDPRNYELTVVPKVGTPPPENLPWFEARIGFFFMGLELQVGVCISGDTDLRPGPLLCPRPLRAIGPPILLEPALRSC